MAAAPQVVQATNIVTLIPAPRSYTRELQSIFVKFSLPALAEEAARKDNVGTTPTDRDRSNTKRFIANDVIEVMRLHPEHSIDRIRAYTSADISAQFHVGILEGDIGEAHEGTGTGDQNRTPAAGNRSTWNPSAAGSTTIGEDDTSALWRGIIGPTDKAKAVGLFCSAASSANETADIEMMIYYHRAEQIG